MNAVFGLDIGSESLKIVQLIRKLDKFELQTAARCPNPLAGIFPEEEKDMVLLAQTIMKLKEEANISANTVVCSLPERKIFTRVIELPKMSEGELAKAVPWEAENIVPQPLSEVNLDWEILGDENDAKAEIMRILLIAAPKILVNGYLGVLKMAGLEPLVLETDFLAINRVISPLLGQKTALVLNLGDKSADLLAIKKGNLFISRSFSSAGEAISRAISVGLGLDFKMAEEYKKTYGLGQELEGKLAVTIEPILAILSEEIKKAIHFFEEKTNERLSLLILSGGTALMAGLTEYFTKALGIEVQVADPFAAVIASPQILQTLKKDAPLFTIAVGLAMRET